MGGPFSAISTVSFCPFGLDMIRMVRNFSAPVKQQEDAGPPTFSLLLESGRSSFGISARETRIHAVRLSPRMQSDFSFSGDLWTIEEFSPDTVRAPPLPIWRPGVHVLFSRRGTGTFANRTSSLPHRCPHARRPAQERPATSFPPRDKSEFFFPFFVSRDSSCLFFFRRGIS